MPRLKKTRMFGGKKYTLSLTRSTKAKANSAAKYYRTTKGVNARVVEYTSTSGRRKGYAIYTSPRKRQGFNARMDESLGMRRGASRTKKQSMKSRRDESKGMSKSMGRRAYASVRSMDRGRRTRR